MAGIAELHKAMNTAWDTAGLESEFKNRWALADRSSYVALNDTEAAPGTPWPYCVYESPAGDVTDRMSGPSDSVNYMVMDVPWYFRVYAMDSQGVSGKAISVALAEKIIETFGGHPSPASSPVDLDIVGYGHLLTQYQNDYGTAIGEQQYLWTIEYLIRLDMPVSV